MATENQKLPLGSYVQQYLKMFPAIFKKKSYFSALVDEIQIDGITHNAIAFKVKVNNQKFTLGDYSKDADTAFGTGTANSSRFGDRTEYIYTDVEVPFDWETALDVGVDKHTVNAENEKAIAEATIKVAEAHVRFIDSKIATKIIAGAGLAITAGADFLKDVDKARQTLTENEVKEDGRLLFVTPELFDNIANSQLMVTGKNATIQIGATQMVTNYKGFSVIEVPVKYMASAKAIATVTQVGELFSGIKTNRVIAPEGFDGMAIQFSEKGGLFLPDDNKQAIVVIA